MTLSSDEKDVLNTLIDHIVNDIEPVVVFARIPEFKGMLKDKDASDFSLGLALGEIHSAFLTGFKKKNGRHLDEEERAELFNTLGRRIGEIHEAIIKCG